MTIRTLALTLLSASLLSTSALAEPVGTHVDYGGPRAVPHEHGDIYSFGRPGQEKYARRTITLTASDDMRHSESTLDFAQGDTVKFVFTNAGSKPHEFVLADKRTQAKVEKARPDPEPVKSQPYSLLLAPGETRTLVWQFDRFGIFEVACHLPGAYKAGMVTYISVPMAPKRGWR